MEQMRERVARDGFVQAFRVKVREAIRDALRESPSERKLSEGAGYCYVEMDGEVDVFEIASAALSLMQPEIDRRVAEEKAKLLERLRVLTTEITSGYRRAVKPRVVMGDDDSIYLTDFQDGELHAVKVMEEKLSAMLAQYEKDNSYEQL